MSTGHDHLSNRELAAMTSDMDQLHHDQAMPAMDASISEWVESIHETGAGFGRQATSRRKFIFGAGVGVGGALLALTGATAMPGLAAAAGRFTDAAPLTGDLAVAAMAASLENLAVFAYKSGLAAAAANKLGTVPPAVGTFATTALAQHQAHAAAWNAALTAAKVPAVTATDPALTPTVKKLFGKVTTAAELAELALLLENTAAQTYQNAIPDLKASSSVAVAASIQPVEMQHAAILYYVLGRYPGVQGKQSNMFTSGSPLAFNPTALARPVSDYRGR
jgi:Ferritin-like domain